MIAKVTWHSYAKDLFLPRFLLSVPTRKESMPENAFAVRIMEIRRAGITDMKSDKKALAEIYEEAPKEKW